MLVQLKKNRRYGQSIFGNEILKSCHGILVGGCGGGRGGGTNTQRKAGEASGLWSRAVWPPSLPATLAEPVFSYVFELFGKVVDRDGNGIELPAAGAKCRR